MVSPCHHVFGSSHAALVGLVFPGYASEDAINGPVVYGAHSIDTFKKHLEVTA